LSLDNHSKVMESLRAFCKEKGILSGSISGIGAVSEMTLRFFSPSTKLYEDRTFCEQMEIANLTGNISLMDGEPYLHIHITAGRSDFTTLSGHLLEAKLNGAGEFVIYDLHSHAVGRTFNPELGLNCYDFSSPSARLPFLRYIAFDADDTLWETERYFREFESNLCRVLSRTLDGEKVSKEIFDTETGNIRYYGYGLKSMMLSMIETTCKLSPKEEAVNTIREIMEEGKSLLQKPVEILCGVRETLSALQGSYNLVIATKGDLMDQKRKIEASGLKGCFSHIEVMNDKTPSDYKELLSHLGCPAENFLMVGNSVKSDILPVLELGGYAIHVPHDVTWAHEEYDGEISSPRFKEFKNLTEIIDYLILK